jgi:hypothetical protein
MESPDWHVLYHDYSAVASQLHREGRYKEAILVSTQAYEVAPVGSSEQGVAARNNAAHFDRIGGQTDTAEHWANIAQEIHGNILESGNLDNNPDALRIAYRENAATLLYVGAIGLRRDIEAQLAGQASSDQKALYYLRRAWTDLQHAQALAPERKIDQYLINAARRLALGFAVEGEGRIENRLSGVLVGAYATALAFISESPRFVAEVNPSLTKAERYRARKRALIGGLASIVVNVLIAEPPKRRKIFALNLADRVL